MPCFDRLVADPGIGGKQDLRPLELAGRVLAAGKHRLQFAAFGFGELDVVA